MNIKQYMLDNKINQTQLAENCVNDNGKSVTQRAISHAIKHNYIIVGNTVYSPRFEINDTLKSGEKEND